jgi:hypothetical protein
MICFSPWIIGKSLRKIWTFPGFNTGIRDKGIQTFLSGWVAPNVESELIQGLPKQSNLCLGCSLFSFAELRKKPRPDKGSKQTDDYHDYEEFDEGKAFFVFSD